MTDERAFPACPPETESCPVAPCRLRCALEVLDDLLSRPGALNGDEVDLVLDLRHALRARESAEEALRLFCEARRKLEHRHYLAFYRLRRWLESNLLARVSGEPGSSPRFLPIKIDFFCPVALRRACLCAALAQSGLRSTRLEFTFRPLPGPTVCPPEPGLGKGEICGPS